MSAALDRLIMDAVDSRSLPSVSVAIGNREGVLYRKSYGYARCFPDGAPVLEYPPKRFTETVPVTSRTLYDAASLTKVVAMESRFPGLRRGPKETDPDTGVRNLCELLREVRP